MEEVSKKIVIPGEVIATGDNYLPGEGTEKQGQNIVAMRYGLSEESERLVKVIAISGPYTARSGNVIIGKITGITFNGWLVDIGTADRAFLPISEYPKYVRSDDLEEFLRIGDMISAKVLGSRRNSVDLSIKAGRGLGLLDEGLVIKINSNKVPRVIGKGGSMVNIIRENTNCFLTVGQNGYIWLKGSKVEEELLAKKAIQFIDKNSTMNGLTERVQEWFKEMKNE